MFKQWFEALSDKIENVLKIGSYSNAKGANGELQQIQIKTLRNIEDALKVGQFGFNSKAPIDSRCIVARIGNESIVIANEHTASIIDISPGDSILYNANGKYIKIEGNAVKALTSTLSVTNDTGEIINILSLILDQVQSLADTLATDAASVAGNGAPLGGLATYQSISTELATLLPDYKTFKE